MSFDLSLNTPHLLVTALLFLAAFVWGGAVGFLARRIVSALFKRPARAAPVASAPLAPVPAAAPEAIPELRPEPVAAPDPEVLDPVQAIDRLVKGPMRPVFALPELPPLAPAPAPQPLPPLSPARRAGETASGRTLWSPFAPVEAPKPVFRLDGGALVIPFPRTPASAALHAASAPGLAELDQLLSRPVPVPVASGDGVVPSSPVPDVQPAGLPAVDTEAVSPQPLPTEQAPLAPEPEPEPHAEPEQMAAIAVEPEPPAPVHFTGLPLRLESQLAAAIGESLDIAPAPVPAAPLTPPPSTPPEPEVALAAFDILADSGAPLPELLAASPAIAGAVPDVMPEPEPVSQGLPEPEPEPEPELEPVAAGDAGGFEPEPVDVPPSEETRWAVIPEPEPVAPLEAEAGVDGDDVNQIEPPAGPEPVALAPDVLPPNAEDRIDADIDDDPDAESAAMRAIEGSWTPRRAAQPVSARAELPEAEAEPAPPGSAVEALAASAAAVASARRTARAVVDEVAPHPARPAALPAPREGGADDLTQIIGVLPVVEAALNRLGVYHYDQIAAWGADTVNWVEAYLGLEGRIGREHWRLQAHELAEAAGKRAELPKAGE